MKLLLLLLSRRTTSESGSDSATWKSCAPGGTAPSRTFPVTSHPAQLQQPPQRLAEVLRRVVDLPPGDRRAAAGGEPPLHHDPLPPARPPGAEETLSRRAARGPDRPASGC